MGPDCGELHRGPYSIQTSGRGSAGFGGYAPNRRAEIQGLNCGTQNGNRSLTLLTIIKPSGQALAVRWKKRTARNLVGIQENTYLGPHIVFHLYLGSPFQFL